MGRNTPYREARSPRWKSANSRFSFTLQPGSYVDITSADKKDLTNNLNIPTICEANQTRVRITLTINDPAKTVTITPASGTCGVATVNSGSSSNGGGGTSQVLAPAPTPTLSPIGSSPTGVEHIPQNKKPSGMVLKRALYFGSRGKDVSWMQQALHKKGRLHKNGGFCTKSLESFL